jgi:hypothetical protein
VGNRAGGRDDEEESRGGPTWRCCAGLPELHGRHGRALRYTVSLPLVPLVLVRRYEDALLRALERERDGVGRKQGISWL